MGEPTNDEERLEALAIEGTLEHLAFVAAHLPIGATEHGYAATRALAGILGRATPADLVHFEAYGRKGIGYWTGWGRLRADAISSLHPSVQRLATFHQSGYVREGAVAALSVRDHEDDLPYLLLRINDWAAPVAVRAATAVVGRVDAKYAGAFVRLLPVLGHLRGARRRDVFGPVLAIEALLASPSSRSALTEGLGAGPRDVRRECVRIAASAVDAAVIELLVITTQDSDPVVATRAADALGARLEGAALRAVLGLLVDSTLAGVRLCAVRALCAAGASDLDPILQRALFDASRAVRELARYELGRRGFRGCANLYASALTASDGLRLAVALQGLGECGSAQDASKVTPFAAHALVRVRAAAVRSLARLAPDESAPLLAAMLEDRSPRVVRLALEALGGRAHFLDRSRLEAMLRGATTPRAACAALALLCEGDLWTALAVAMRAVRGSQEPTLRRASVAHLERLLSRHTFVRPSNFGELEAAAQGLEHAIPDALRHHLESVLASARLMR